VTQYVTNFGAMTDGEAVTRANIASSGYDFYVPGTGSGVAVVADTFPSGAIAVEEAANSDTFCFNLNGGMSTNGLAWSVEFFYKGTMPGSNDYLWDVRFGSGTGSSGVRCIINSSGFPFVQATGSTIWTGTTTKLVVGTKYRCDFELTRSATAGTVRVRFYKCSAPSTVLTGLDSTALAGKNTGSSAFTDVSSGAAGGNTVTGCTRAYGLIRGDDATTTTWGAPPNNITIVVNDHLGLTDGAAATHSVPGGTTTITVNDHLGLTDTGAPQTVVHTITVADLLGLTDAAVPSGSSAGGSNLPIFRDSTSVSSGGSPYTGSFSINVPAAAQVGDVAVLMFMLNSTALTSASSPGGAWTAQSAVLTPFYCYSRVLTAADLGHTVTVFYTGNFEWAAVVACWSSCSGVTVASGAFGASTTNVALPSIAPIWDQTLIAGFGAIYAAASTSTTWTVPAGWTNEAAIAATPNGMMIVCADQVGVPEDAYAASGAFTFTAPFAGAETLGITLALAGSPAALDAVASTSLIVHHLLGTGVVAPVGGTGVWPQIVTQAMFGQGPNVGGPALLWTDISGRLKQASITRGASYELAQASPGSGQLLLDNADAALDPSNTSSPYWPDVQIMCPVRQFAILGGVAYPIWGAYVFGWGQTWEHDDYANVQASLVDSLATMQAGLLPVLASAMLTSSPTHLWPLSESLTQPVESGSAVVWQFSDEGSSQLPLFCSWALSAPSTDEVLTTGATLPARGGPGMPLAAADSSEGVEFAIPITVNGDTRLTGAASDGINLFPQAGQVVTWEMFVTWQFDAGQLGPNTVISVDDGTVEWLRFTLDAAQIVLKDGTTTFAYPPGPDYMATPPNFSGFQDGVAHHIVVTLDATGGSLLLVIAVDGVPNAYAAVSSTALPSGPVSNINIGGSAFQPSYGTVDVHAVAFYQRYLGTDEIADHWAAYIGYPGDLTGTRVERLLDWANWNAPAVIDAGASTMQPASGVGGSTLAAQMQQVTDTEFGVQYPDASGNMVFAGRGRLLTQTPQAVFGDGGGSEIPYEPDIGFSLDATYVYDRVAITRNNGAVAASRTAETTELVFGNTLTKTIYSDTDEDAFNQANYLAAVYSQPQVRLQTITIDVLALITQDDNAGTALTQTLLALDILSVVTVTRRGVSTSSGQYRIEQISDTTTPDSWLRAYQLSPLQPAPLWGIPGDYTDTYGDTY
jgi:hypothetical protein